MSFADGHVATYIPELGRADPEDFGISLATSDGRMFETGDSDRPFTIQSISKPFMFGLALEEFSAHTVAQHVGVEPSGDAFNAIELQRGASRTGLKGVSSVTRPVRFGTAGSHNRPTPPGGSERARCTGRPAAR